MVEKVIRRFKQTTQDFLDPRQVTRWFQEAGPGADVFPIRPFLGDTSIFPTKSGGVGALLELAGLEIDGVTRADLDFVAKACGAALRSLPEGCVIYRYDVVREMPPVDAPLHEDEAIAWQQIEYKQFLEETAHFKHVSLYVALYLKSPAWPGISPEKRKRVKRQQLREIESAVRLYQEILSSIVPVRVCTPSETTAFYSYLRTLEAEMVRTKPLKTDGFARYLGNTKIKFDSGADCLRVGHRYVQPFSLLKRPEGSMPALWRDVFKIQGVEFVLCHIYRQKTSGAMRRNLLAREQAAHFGAVNIGAAVMGALSGTSSQQGAAPVSATQVATDRNVKKLGKVMAILGEGAYTYGDYSLFGLVHSRDLEKLRAAMPRFHRAFRVPGDAQIEEEDEANGALAAYLSCFPGNLGDDSRHRLLRSDHFENVTFPYKPFSGLPWSDDLQAPYTLLLQTPEGVPFYFNLFYEGEGNYIVIGGKRRGKSFTVNRFLAAAAKHNGYVLIIDTGDSYSHNIRSQGGAATRVSPAGPRLNPFRQERTAKNISAITFLVATMIRKSGIALKPGDQAIIRQKVEEVYELPYDYQRLKYLQKRLPAELKPGLDKWVHGDPKKAEEDGEYAAVWDNVEDEFALARRQAIDLKEVKAPQYKDLRETVLYWIFYLFRRVIDDPANLGVPKTVVGEEMFTHIDDEQIVNEMLLVGKTDARMLGQLIVVVHSIDDLGPHRNMIRAACPNTICLGGAMDRKQYTEFFQFNQAQLDLIEGLKRRELLLVVHGMSGFTKKLISNVDPATHARITTKPSEMRLRLDLIEQHGYTLGMRLFEKAMAEQQKQETKALAASSS